MATGLLENFNNLLHQDYFDDFAYYNFFVGAWIFQPVFAILILVYDLLSGHVFPLCYIKPSKVQVVFVTGCDTGFGKALAIRLASRGMKVYAACLTDQGIEALRKEAREVNVIKLDVTKSAEIQQAADMIESENPQGLYALVNNAGVAKSALIDWSTLNDYRFVMEVNFFGTVAVTKAFLPLIKRTQGRIINVSSVAGISCGYPLSSAYASSKHAVEVFTSTLRQELRPWGIKVCTLNPGFHKTEMNHVAVEGLRRCWTNLPQELKDQYGEAYAEGCADMVHAHTWEQAYDPKHVIKAMEHAVCATRPRVQYLIGLDAKFGFSWSQIFPLRVGERVVYAASSNAKMRKINGLKPIAA